MHSFSYKTIRNTFLFNTQHHHKRNIMKKEKSIEPSLISNIVNETLSI